VHVKEKDSALFIENSLKPVKQRKVEEHLSTCGLCRRRLRQWENLYNAIELLDFDFELDGLEEKVIDKIKNTVSGTKPVDNVLKFPVVIAAAFVLLILTSIVFIPVNKIISGMAGNIASLVLNAGVSLIQKIKWPLRNIISFILADKTVNILSVVSAAILIIGGVCFLISNMFNKKLKRA